jgi:Domain of unknown function (DUF4347)
MAGSIRECVSELMIYDADDELSSDEAKKFLDSHQFGAWTVNVAGIHGAAELSKALQNFVNIEQLSFCSHGSPGSVYFMRGSLTARNLKSVIVPYDLFKGAGRLLFMGCETARTKTGEDFLIAAGKHFFAGKGGVVGGSTIYNLGFSSGTRLPLLGFSSGGLEIGKLILFHLDAKGNVIGTKTVRPFGL